MNAVSDLAIPITLAANAVERAKLERRLGALRIT
jgi:hypothetical protein